MKNQPDTLAVEMSKKADFAARIVLQCISTVSVMLVAYPPLMVVTIGTLWDREKSITI